jgi:long-chain acyl-CoA synthetase
MTPSFPSVAALFEHRVKASANDEAYSFPDASENWQRMTWAQVGARVKAIAGGLRALGIHPEDRVAILAATRIEWILVDFGINCAGAATTTVYPTSSIEDCEHILKDSVSRVLIAENDKQAKKIQTLRDAGKIPDLFQIVVIDGADSGDVISLATLEKRGEAWHKENPGAYEDGVKAVKPEHLATLIYTSGTTGRPKGVELTNANWVYEGDTIDAADIIKSHHKQFLWLPLSHSFGKVLEVASLKIGFPTAIDGRPERIVPNLAIVKPAFMAAAPRIFEKAYNGIVSNAKAGGANKYKIFQWALGVGRQVSQLRQNGEKPGFLLNIQFKIADKLVFGKIRDRFGGNIAYMISGSAALSRDMAEVFDAVGMPIMEGYGLTETSAASFVNLPATMRFGTVGRPLTGTEVKIAEDGEVLIRGGGVMRGYRNLPEETAKKIDGEGWLHTDDLGALDPEGRLMIRGRKNDIFKTSSGKYVDPDKIESRLKAVGAPWLSQVLLHGKDRNFCSTLITLDPERAVIIARENNIDVKIDTVDGKEILLGDAYATVSASPAARALVQSAIDVLNKDLGSWETVKQFALLPADFAVETGELTPSMKVKRKIVEQKYKATLDGFYANAKAD